MTCILTDSLITQFCWVKCVILTLRIFVKFYAQFNGNESKYV